MAVSDCVPVNRDVAGLDVEIDLYVGDGMPQNTSRATAWHDARGCRDTRDAEPAANWGRPYFIPPRIEPTIPPTTPPSVRCSLPLGRYSISACASLDIGRDCNHTRPGPVSAARKIPSPPKIMLLIPGMRAIWKLTPAWNAPTWPGCTRKVSPARRSLVTTSPESSIQAVPAPLMCCNRKPSPPKMPAPSDC